MSDPALCPAKFSSEASIREDRRYWPSSLCLSFLGPWSHVVQLPRPVHDKFFDQPPAVVRTQTSRLSTRLQLLSDMLRCELAVVKFSITGIQDTLNCDSTDRSLLCEGTSSLLCSPSTLRLVSEAPSPRASPFQLECRTRCHCHLEITELLAFRVFDPHPIFPTHEFSSNEYCKIESRAPLLPSCCFGKHVQDLLSKFQICVAASFRHCRCRTCSSDTQRIPPASKVSSHQGGMLTPIRCSNAAFSVLAWPATNPTVRLVIPLDWLSPTGRLSGTI